MLKNDQDPWQSNFFSGPVGGVEIKLIDATQNAESPGVVVRSATTDKQGNYSFTEVEPGTYTLSMSPIDTALLTAFQDCELPGSAVRGDWVITSGELTTAQLQKEFSVSTSDIIRYDLQIGCE